MSAVRPLNDEAVGLLVAGGRGTRSGLDKRFLVLEGQTLLRRNLDFLRARFASVVVSVAPGQRPDFGDAPEPEVLHDAWPGESPLAGLATALAALRRPVFAMAVDLAAPDDAALRRVLTASRGYDVALPSVGGRLEPLFAVYDPACLPAMVAALQADDHKIVRLLPRLRVAEVPFADAAPFLNVNTPADYDRARALTGASPAAGGAPALVAVVARSGSGKTTFIEKLIPELLRLGLRVGAVKHDAHHFEIDRPGKDSWRLGQAGAAAYVISSRDTLAYVAKLDDELSLPEIARRFFGGFDLVVAEGYRRSAPYCIELVRTAAGCEGLLTASPQTIAVVSDAAVDREHVFGLEDAAGVARFLAARLGTLRDY